MTPKLVISIGDINGIGPEVILKSLIDHDYSASVPIIVSPFEVIGYYSDSFNISLDLNYCTTFDDISLGRINVLWDEGFDSEIQPGTLTAASGSVAIQSIVKCVELLQNGDAQAMVTAPISKEAVNLAGYKITGHTEFLAEKCEIDEVLMMLINGDLRVALVTGHIPISDISSTITCELIHKKAQLLHHSLKFDFGIHEPKIAVLGLNPHAGDGGVIGKEEINVLRPAIKNAQEIGIQLEGPFPADGFFGHQLHNRFDAILAMYHDQGLAPFKLLSFGKGVNVTAGLPIIRTSPDHGTAFNIAGKNLASSSSFKQAVQLAIELSHQRYGL